MKLLRVELTRFAIPMNLTQEAAQGLFKEASRGIAANSTWRKGPLLFTVVDTSDASDDNIPVFMYFKGNVIARGLYQARRAVTAAS